jgi:hypothetical protein
MKPCSRTFLLSLMAGGALAAGGERVHAILAGGETALPADSPAIRLDPSGANSVFNAVGALAITANGFSYIGTGTAISPHWVLTAGHNLDSNDNGLPDVGLGITFHLPGFGSFTASAFHIHPGFTGFGSPSVQRDLGLLYFEEPLPGELFLPAFHTGLTPGDTVTLVGFGRSGYGDYGYTTSASLTDRRRGENVVDSFAADDQGGGFPALFYYDFDAPGTTGLLGGSLGNDRESIIGPGDSGGPLLLFDGESYSLAGINTFTEGYGGRFGDVGGGVVIGPYLDWITATTAIPEPSVFLHLLLGLALGFAASRQGRLKALPERPGKTNPFGKMLRS